MPAEQQQLEAGIRALEAQRGLLGDAVVDAMVAPARAKLAALAADALAHAPPADPAQTLKQVTILFLDVVDSTALAQQLDPEAVSAVMDDALSRGTALVEAHRGRVLQYAGDNILAAFGADTSREDDAERAVQCGLALLGLGKTLGAEVLAGHGRAGVDVRVGVHTGGVLLGGGVDAEGTIRGSAVNIAARMEQTAPPGGLRISHDTYAQVRGLFEVELQKPLAVKGVDAPIQSYLVKRAKPRNFRIRSRGIEGVVTRMIGRDVELEALQTAFKRLFTERRLAAVTVVAEVGMGKSRLLYEFEAWSETRPETFFLFRGRATPQTGMHAFGLLRDIIAWRFQISDDDSIAAARRKLEAGILPLFLHDDGPDLAEGHTHLLGHLIGIEWQDSRHIKGILDDPKQIRNRAFHAAAQMFRRLSASKDIPIVLQLEDLHWADDESLDFLNYLTEVDRDVPLLMLALTRPTLFERRTDWRSTEGVHQRIDMDRLDERASRDLTSELLKKLPEIPAALRELLTGNAEGNPFYMEELVRMLIEQGAIAIGDTWKMNVERFVLAHVPTTLTGVLQARLDGLPAPEKNALQQASIIGPVFWDLALAAVDSRSAGQVAALVQRELVLRRDVVAGEDLREYGFCHQLLHQVTYGTVLKRVKQEGHAKVAQWLAAWTVQRGLRAGDFLGAAAEHFEQAGDAGNAAEFHARAAEQAGQRFAHVRVLSHVQRALALLGKMQPAHGEILWRALQTRELTLGLLARRTEQAADIHELGLLADKFDDDRRRAYVAWRGSVHAMRIADWQTMESTARHGLACATRAGDDNLRLHALRLLATARVYQGDIETGQALAQQGLSEARRLGLRGAEARLLNALAGAAGQQNDLPSFLALHRQSLQGFRFVGDRVNEAVALANLGGGWKNLGELEQAGREMEAALQMLRSNGDRVSEGAMLGNLSSLALWQGNEVQALALARSALEIVVAANARDKEVTVGLQLGAAQLAFGSLGESRRAYARALTLALAIQSPKQHDASAGLARVAMAEGDSKAALNALAVVLDQVPAGGTLIGTEDEREIELTCHRALADAGDLRAFFWLARAHSALIAQANAISEPALRQCFLSNIPHHRQIVAAWSTHDAAGQALAKPPG